ncbi:MAG TPA: IS1182 family transposase [Ferruginibacter sp.]|nr:IS1182 family transposase [Ferruginibacter sp.]
MQFIQGKNREQSILFPQSLDQIIAPDNEVRIIDLFAESIQLEDFKFITKTSKEGRPAYHPKDLLKLFVYGYLNHIRSSRLLEKECKRNIELMWLMKQLAPDHNTISNFRRDNEKAIRKVFRHTVSIAKHFDLIGGTLVAGDSTKLRAQNSKKNNFNEGKVERHLAYIDARLDEYNKALAEADEENKGIIEEEIKKQNDRKGNYENMDRQLTNSGEPQISTSDPDSRQMMTRNNISEVAYNVQTVVDAKHYLPIDYKVTNTNDSKAMSGMLRRAKTILKTKGFTALYDKGYHTGSEIKKALELNVEIMVAIPAVGAVAPDENYNFVHFKYDEATDTYTCPQHQVLTSNGNWYQKNKERYFYLSKHYKTPACINCAARTLCTKNQKGRVIERSEYAPYMEINKCNIEANPETYKKRQAIVEHPYGTIKRQWGFYYIITKRGLKRASADVGFMFVAYNLRRLINIIDKNMLTKFLRELVVLFFHKVGSLNALRTFLCLPILAVVNNRDFMPTFKMAVI